ncbi:MAG: hypothetical protein HY770_01225 [Chitinivibrionia bacterium]|nr:hypothetical protein [Chitinivibrionia bacterium]
MRTLLTVFLACAAVSTLMARDTDFLVLDNQKALLVVGKDKDDGRLREVRLSDYKGVKTEGYKSARVFYQLTPKNSRDNEGKLTGNNFVELSWCHELPGGSVEIESKKVYSKSTTLISVLTEFPIFGNESKMLVTGAVPDDTYEVTCSIYLVK